MYSNSYFFVDVWLVIDELIFDCWLLKSLHCFGVFLTFYVKWFLLHEIGYGNIWEICKYSCYLFLLNCSLYQYVVSCFSSSVQFWHEFSLSQIRISVLVSQAVELGTHELGQQLVLSFRFWMHGSSSHHLCFLFLWMRFVSQETQLFLFLFLNFFLNCQFLWLGN